MKKSALCGAALLAVTIVLLVHLRHADQRRAIGLAERPPAA